MSQSHYITKTKRRRVSKSRSRKEAKRIAVTMRRIKELEKRDRILREEGIDTTDIPEVTDWSGAEIGKFYRNSKLRGTDSRP
jgi:hypothetical protein